MNFLLSPAALLLLVFLGSCDAKSPKYTTDSLTGPSIAFKRFCPTVISFNSVYNKYEIQIPLSLAGGSSELELVDIQANVDPALGAAVSGLRAIAHTAGHGTGILSLLCISFQRCKIVRNEMIANPRIVQRAVSFTVLGNMGSRQVQASGYRGVMESGSMLTPSCNRGWIVFQRRVDGSLSFYQNWETYKKGFGNPNSNYWMGLDNLNAATSAGVMRAKCQLKVEIETVTGKKLRGVWKQFYVDQAFTHYKMYVKTPAKGNSLPNHGVSYMNGARFSTYDSDHDTWPKNCARHYGFGGWWYKKCFQLSLNGVYPDKPYFKHALFASVLLHRKHIPVVKTKMSYKCNDLVKSTETEN